MKKPNAQTPNQEKDSSFMALESNQKPGMSSGAVYDYWSKVKTDQAETMARSGGRAKPVFVVSDIRVVRDQNGREATKVDFAGGLSIVDQGREMNFYRSSSSLESKRGRLRDLLTLIRERGWAAARMSGASIPDHLKEEIKEICESLGIPVPAAAEKDIPKMYQEQKRIMLESYGTFDSPEAGALGAALATKAVKSMTPAEKAALAEKKEPERIEFLAKNSDAPLMYTADLRLPLMEKIEARAKVAQEREAALPPAQRRNTPKQSPMPTRPKTEDEIKIKGQIKILNSQEKDLSYDMRQENKKKEAALTAQMTEKQVDAWRNELYGKDGLQSMKDSGAAMTPEQTERHERLQKLAEQYGIKPTKEEETKEDKAIQQKGVRARDMDPDVSKEFKKGQAVLKSDSMLAEAAQQKMFAEQRKKVLNGEPASLTIIHQKEAVQQKLAEFMPQGLSEIGKRKYVEDAKKFVGEAKAQEQTFFQACSAEAKAKQAQEQQEQPSQAQALALAPKTLDGETKASLPSDRMQTQGSSVARRSRNRGKSIDERQQNAAKQILEARQQKSKGQQQKKTSEQKPAVARQALELQKDRQNVR